MKLRSCAHVAALSVSLMFAGVSTGFSQQRSLDEVIWIVGDEPILKSEVEVQILEAQRSNVKFEGNPYCVIPEQIAIQKLFLHQAALDSITSDEANIIRSVDAKINEWVSIAGSKEKLEEYQGKSIKDIRADLAEHYKNEDIVSQVQKKIVGGIKVTPADVRRYFKDVPEDSLPYIPRQYEVQIIKKAPEVPREEIDRVQNELLDYAQRVNSGESDFSTLAMLYSEDTGSARQGGDLDYRGRGFFVPEFASVAFNLSDPKKVSKIVKTEFGYHILQLVDKRGDKVRVRHILRKPKISDQDMHTTLLRLDSIATFIRDKKFTFEEAAADFSDDKDTRNNLGIMFGTDNYGTTETSKFELKDLPQEVAKVVEGMNVGDISEAFTINSRGKQECAIVKLKNIVEGHRANVQDDFQSMKDQVQNVKMGEKLDKWIKEKLKTTYVKIKDDWKDCNFKYSGWIK